MHIVRAQISAGKTAEEAAETLVRHCLARRSGRLSLAAPLPASGSLTAVALGAGMIQRKKEKNRESKRNLVSAAIVSGDF